MQTHLFQYKQKKPAGKMPMKKNSPLILAFLCFTLAALLAGCSGSKNIPQGRGGYRPYTVRGKTYYPVRSAEGYSEEGIASWYGPGFHGKKTASGERFNQNDLTAAHKLLPFGTKLRVTNLSNGREVVVRVNDRGPFSSRRIIDLSKKAAQKLGMLAAGTAKVRISAQNGKGGQAILTPEGDMLGLFYVQVGSFEKLVQADELAVGMRARGYGCRTMRRSGSRTFVQLGPYLSRSAAEKAAQPLYREFRGLFIVAE